MDLCVHAAVSSGPVRAAVGLCDSTSFYRTEDIGQWVGRRRPAEFGSARLPPGSAARWRLAAGGRHGAGGEEARRTIERGTTPNYRSELETELKEVRDSELWQTGATVRQLRSKAAEKVEELG